MADEPKRAKIGVEQEAIIAKFALDFRDMPRTKLAEKIQAEVKWPGKAPEIEVLERKISLYRKDSDSPQDKPWTLDSLRDYPLPPDALPKLFQIWLYKQGSPLERPLSIREARWAAQLSSMTDDIELLRLMAEMCTEWELIGELTGTAQLSSPTTILYIYSQLTAMDDKKLKEHHQDILSEKLGFGTRRGETMEGLKAFYGDEFIRATKSKKEAHNERTHSQEV